MAYHRRTNWKQTCLEYFSWACVDKSHALLFGRCTFLGEHHPWPVCHLVRSAPYVKPSLWCTKHGWHWEGGEAELGCAWCLDVPIDLSQSCWVTVTEEMSGQEKENCGAVAPGMAQITGLAGDLVPSDPGTLSAPECSENQECFPMAARTTYLHPTAPCHCAWGLGKMSVP